jgi:predicted nucleic acid-binding protein
VIPSRFDTLPARCQHRSDLVRPPRGRAAEHIRRSIGEDDLLIAQTMALGYTIVTDNEAEFARINGPGRGNWLR